jgi:hypothetical protein
MNWKFDENFKELVLKKPLILVGFFFIIIGIVLLLLNLFISAGTIQNFLTGIAILVLIIIVLLSILETYYAYKRNDRPFDSFVIPLFFSVFFICLTLILLLFFGILRPIYIASVEPELNHIIFPLAIFALGISLYYFFLGQFSTDRKLSLILKLSNEKCPLKTNEPAISDSNNNDAQKDYVQVTGEDKIIFEHLFQRHNNLLLFIDALDTKFSQIIALNGLILSFILIKSPDVKNIYVYIFGLSLIVLTIIIGIFGYRTREYLTGVHEKFFSAYDSYEPGVGIKKLKDQLVRDIEVNTDTQNQKAKIFDKMLLVNIIALIVVIIGYYV